MIVTGRPAIDAGAAASNILKEGDKGHLGLEAVGRGTIRLDRLRQSGRCFIAPHEAWVIIGG